MFIIKRVPKVILPSGDPYFNYVVSLLHFDGTNGSTTITDQILGNSWSCGGATALSTGQFKFGTASANWPTNNVSNRIVGPSTMSAFVGDFTIEFWFYPITNSTSYSSCLCGVDRTSGPRGVQVGWQTGNNINILVSGGASVVSSNTCTLNSWNYVGAAASGTLLTLNLNGIITTGTWVVGQGNAANAFTFGAHVDGITNYKGFIDEFRLTKGVARNISGVPTEPFPNY